MSPDLAPLFPPGVALAAGRIAEVDGLLWPEEAARIAKAADKRRAEFLAGRVLARAALAALGAPDGPLPAGPDRAPVWPPGYTGSISHTDTWVAVAAGVGRTFRALGVDIEEIGRFHPRLEGRILTPAEIAAHLDGLPPADRQARTAALFCVKEAFFKCQFPLTGLRLGFHDVVVDIQACGNRAAASPVLARRIADAASVLAGGCVILGDLAAAGFSVPA